MNNAAFPVLLGLMIIDGTNRALRMQENTTLGGTGLATVNVATGAYFLRGDGGAGDILPAVVTALNSHGNATTPNTYGASIALDTDAGAVSGTVEITRNSGTSSYSILWDDPLTTFPKALLGFSESTAFSGANKSSDLSPSCIWVGNDIYRMLEPKGSTIRKRSRALSKKVRVIKRRGEVRDRLLMLDYVDERRMMEEASQLDPTAALNRFLDRHADGKRFEFHDGTLTAGSSLDSLSSDTLQGVFIFDDDFYPDGGLGARLDGAPLYSLQGHLLPYV